MGGLTENIYYFLTGKIVGLIKTHRCRRKLNNRFYFYYFLEKKLGENMDIRG